MKNLVFRTKKFLTIVLCGTYNVMLAGCVSVATPKNQTLYYGFLKGEPYIIFESRKNINLNGQPIKLNLIDARNNNVTVECANFELDRKTELEGNTGYNLVKEYFIETFKSANAKIENEAMQVLNVEIEGLSFRYVGFVQITIHGIVQLNVIKNNQSKKYCIDITDKDDDEYSPLKWYSFDTRVGAGRKMVSASIRKAVDQILLEM